MKGICWLGLGIASFQAFLINPCFAQSSDIVPDNSLGAESSQKTENFQGLPIERITGGAQRGINLFHSFREFNVSEGRGAYFFSPNADVQNILARVTGRNPSEILGTLGTLGNSQPNLFLINPNGIVFGENASLDVGGSFVASTANGLQFGEQGVFSATNPEAPALLTVNPSALFFNQINQNAGIRNSSIEPAGMIDRTNVQVSGLRVPDGKSLLLVGGNVILDGGWLNAFGGRIELGGLIEPGNVDLSVSGDNLSLGFSENVARGDVSLKNSAIVLVRGTPGGSIKINSRNLEVVGGSRVSGGIAPGLGTPEMVSGNITLNATGEIQVADSGSQILNSVPQNSKGSAGNIIIDASSFKILNKAWLLNSTFGQGNAGNIKITAKDIVFVEDARILNTVEFGGVGKGGNIEIDAKNVKLGNRGEISASTAGIGNAGSITIKAADNISLNNGNDGTYIFNNVVPGAFGNTSGVNIITNSLSVTNGAQIRSQIFGEGNTGKVTIIAKEAVSFDGQDNNKLPSAILSQVREDGTGNSEGISIITKSLSITNGAALSSATFGNGNASDINIKAKNTVLVDGGKDATAGRKSSDTSNNLGVTVEDNAIGNGGNLIIETGSFLAKNGGRISGSTEAQGDSGNIIVRARDTISFDESFAFSSVDAEGEGNAGNIEIQTGSLFVTNGSRLISRTEGRGNAGDVIVQANDKVFLDGKKSGTTSGIFTNVRGEKAKGTGGDIKITTDFVSVSNNAQLSANTLGEGEAGNIAIAANTIEASKGGQLLTETSSNFDAGNINLNIRDNIKLSGSETGLFANTLEGSTGKGGNIFIDPRIMIIEDNAKITVDSQGEGIGGDIELEADFLTLVRGKISAETRSNNGGNIKLVLQDLLLLRNDSKISTNAGNQQFGGDGGNIDINSKFIVALPEENSDITANAFEGRGGNINIFSQGIFGIEPRQEENNLTSDITASSDLGVSGNLNITDPDDSNIRNNLDELDSEQINTDSLIANSCISRSNKRQENSFTITGSGGLRNSPGDELVSQYSTGEVRNVEPTSRIWKKGDVIIEPTGVYKLSDGKILLSRTC